MKPFLRTSFLGTRPSCLPSPGRPLFDTDDPKAHFMTGRTGSPVKTEFLLVDTRQQLDKLDSCSITVGNNRISPSPCVRNLGSWFDSNLSMTDHINKACNAAFYHLHNLRRIKKYLSRDSLITLVHAFITSRLDYCNGLLFEGVNGVNQLATKGEKYY